MNAENIICFEIKNLDNLVRRMGKKYITQFKCEDITRMHGWIIGYLYNNQDKEIYQKDIETEFNIQSPTVTGILKLMEKNNLIVRETVKNDARLKKIVLTQKAKDFNKKIENSIIETEQIIRKDLSKEEIELFFKVIQKMKENIINEF